MSRVRYFNWCNVFVCFLEKLEIKKINEFFFFFFQGHDIILRAFDNVKQELSEVHRFETLMYYFSHYESFQIEFMVACMQFINIVVHSVEDMNFRVALQWEFSYLGLEDCLDKLRMHESEELAVQISGKSLF